MQKFERARVRPDGLNYDGVDDGTGQFYTVMTNAIMREGLAVRAPMDQCLDVGQADNAVAGTPNWIMGYTLPETNSVPGTPQNRAILSQTLKLIGYSATDDFVDITPSVGGWPAYNEGQISGGLLNGIPFVNNPGRSPVTWTGATALPTLATALAGWPANYQAKVLRSYRDFLVAGHVYDGTQWNQDQIIWSDRAGVAALPTTWTAAATNEAGDATLGDTQGQIVDMCPLGSANLIYKDSSVYLMEEIGFPEVFAIRMLTNSFGLAGLHCVQNFNGNHILFSNYDVLEYDGRQARSILSPYARQWLNDLIVDSGLGLDISQAYTVLNRRAGEFWLCLPQAPATYNHVSTALIWNGMKWSRRDFHSGNQINTPASSTGNEGYPHIHAATFRQLNGSGERLLAVNPDAGVEAGVMRILDREGSSEDTAEMTLEVTGLELAKGKVTTIQRIWPVGHDLGTMNITLGRSDSRSRKDTPTWGTAQSWTTVSEPVGVPSTARYHGVRLNVPASTDTPAKIAGFDIDFTVGQSW